MKDPAVLFYPGDFLNGVIDMTMEERGQYITLLCYQHQKGHIKEETIRLLVGSCSVNVLEHFKIDKNGLYYNPRMELEMEKRHNFTESRRQNGLKGGRPKQEETKPSGKPTKNLVVNHMDNHMGNENININKDKIKALWFFPQRLLVCFRLKTIVYYLKILTNWNILEKTIYTTDNEIIGFYLNYLYYMVDKSDKIY